MSTSPSPIKFQRGAVGIVGVLTLLMILLLSALVVDSGRLWMQEKKLQSIADIAAIEAARNLGCNSSLQNALQLAQLAAARNGFDGQLADSPNQVLLGRLDTVQGVRQFTADGSGAAVYVKATRTVPSSLIAGGLFGGTVTLNAEAVSMADPSLAAFEVGSYTATINSDQSALLNGLLGGMLGAPLNLDVLTYRGIATTRVTLQNILAVYAQVGTLSELLSAQIPVAELLEVFATAASQESTADLQVIAAMQTIASATVSSATVRLGDILAVTTADANAAATVGLNALSLITTTAMVANGSNAVTLPLGINVPPLTSINAQITVIEPPQMTIGPAAGGSGTICTVARTAQVRAKASVSVNVLLASIDLALNLEVAQGSAGLRNIQQGEGETSVGIEASPGIASLSLTNNAGTGPARITTLLGLLPLADIGLNLPIQPPGSQTLDYTVANPVKDHLPQTQSVSSSVGSSLANALGQSNALQISVLGIDLGLLNTIVSTVVSPLLSAIGQVLLDPLLNLLGVEVGGLDVTLDAVQYRQAKPLVI